MWRYTYIMQIVLLWLSIGLKLGEVSLYIRVTPKAYHRGPVKIIEPQVNHVLVNVIYNNDILQITKVLMSQTTNVILSQITISQMTIRTSLWHVILARSRLASKVLVACLHYKQRQTEFNRQATRKTGSRVQPKRQTEMAASPYQVTDCWECQ